MAHDNDYRTLNAELDTILGELQDSSLDITAAIERFERGEAIIKQLERSVQSAENKIKKIRAAFDGGGQ